MADAPLVPEGPEASRRIPPAAPAFTANTLTTGLAKARYANRDAESTVVCTDSVDSRTAPTRSISVAAWSTTLWASATIGTS
ncbi:MAG TPA: hypothetical protein VG205_02365 [Acidimicrobiales bacterium]|nr:hypothetical protein [Acidimicrobiales bacterium]